MKPLRTVKDFFGGVGKPKLKRKATTKRKPIDPKDHHGAANAARIIDKKKKAQQKILDEMPK